MVKRKTTEAPERNLQEKIAEAQVDNLLSEISSQRKPLRKRLPKTFKVGRALMANQDSIENQLFDILEAKETRSFEVCGVAKSITPKLLHQTTFALCQVLSNTSYQYGNEEAHTGMAVDGKCLKTHKEPLKGTEITKEGEVVEKEYHYAEIRTSLKELAKFAFGVDEPTGVQRQEIEKALYAMQNDGVDIAFGGKVYHKSLVWVEGWVTREKENDLKEVYLVLNPIFGRLAAKSYAKHPQDASKRLNNAVKKVTIHHLRLRDLLANQKVKKEPFRRYISTLLKEIGLWEKYQSEKKRYMAKLEEMFKAMVDIKLLNSMPERETGATGELEFIFDINKDYAKPIKN
jgi:hypothetical protein